MLNANELLQKGIEQVKLMRITIGNINPEVEINTTTKTKADSCKKTLNKYDFKICVKTSIANLY